ncbi:MAG: DNA double-strand break repair nuclease NurA [Thermoproteota archaeon]
MVIEAVRRLVERLDGNLQEGDLGEPSFRPPENYRHIPFCEENFKPIPPVDCDKLLFFVDGGNQEIVGAPNFSVQLNRVYFSVFRGGERVLENFLPERVEFFSATHSRCRNEKIFYDTLLIPVKQEFQQLLPDEEDLSFDSMDRTVMNGVQRANISQVASIARKFAEWSYARHLIQEEMEEGDVLVRDGSLRATFTHEAKYAQEVYEAARSKDVILTGLCKSSRLFTTTGLSLLGAVSKFAVDHQVPYESWYLPVAEAESEEHNAMIFVVKLAEVADYIFRYELDREQFRTLEEEEVERIMCQLAENARDVSFPGYPYGLVDADRFARVTEEDVEGYRALLLSEVSKQGGWEKFSRHIRAMDAHSILNRLMR